MNPSRTNLILATLATMLTMPPTVRAQVPPVPSDAALDNVARKQRTKSAEDIARAQRQAERLNQPVPDVDPVVPMPLPASPPVPDPAAIAQRHAIAPRSEDGFYVLISLSMPLPTITQLAQQASKAGAPLVLRGVADNSLQKTLERTAEIVRQHPGVQIQIDPTLFRRFKVTEVPAFILSQHTVTTPACTANCASDSSYSLVTGDVSIEYALEHLTRHSAPPLAALAKARLQRYRGSP